jgi:hypothetical protein
MITGREVSLVRVAQVAALLVATSLIVVGTRRQVSMGRSNLDLGDRRSEFVPLGYTSCKFVGFGAFGAEVEEKFDFTLTRKKVKVSPKSEILVKEGGELDVITSEFIDTNGRKDVEVTANFKALELDFFARTDVSAPDESVEMCSDKMFQLVTPVGVDSLISIDVKKIEIATEYGTTLVLEHDLVFEPMVCNAVVRNNAGECEIYVYDILSSQASSTECLVFNTRINLLQGMDIFRRARDSGCFGSNHVFSRFSIRLAKVSICSPAMRVDYDKFNFFIRSTFLRLRNAGNFFFFTGHAKVDVIIKDNRLAIERRRYNSSDTGSRIDFGVFEFRDCRLQGLLYDGCLRLMMTRISRLGDRDCSMIRYGFSQLRILRNVDVMALLIKALFDVAVFKGSRVFFSQRNMIERMTMELKLFKDDQRERDKRRARTQEQIARRRELRLQYYGFESDSWNHDLYRDPNESDF